MLDFISCFDCSVSLSFVICRPPFSENKSNSTGIPLSFHVPPQYWVDIGSKPNDVTDTAERILATYGLNLYDGSVWAIAVALNGEWFSLGFL
jgi:hypothetical protein